MKFQLLTLATVLPSTLAYCGENKPYKQGGECLGSPNGGGGPECPIGGKCQWYTNFLTAPTCSCIGALDLKFFPLGPKKGWNKGNTAAKERAVKKFEETYEENFEKDGDREFVEDNEEE